MISSPLKTYFRRLLTLEDSPERIAFAFAVGIFLAFSPLLGLHTFLGLVLAFLFGLNRPAILVGVFVNNPWTLVPIYAMGNWVGGFVIGIPVDQRFPTPGWDSLWSSRFWVELAHGWRLFVPLVVGSFTLAVVAAFLAYFLALRVVRQERLRALRSSLRPPGLSTV